MNTSVRLQELTLKAEDDLRPHFERIDRISHENTNRVLDAFRDMRVSDAMFSAGSGYGYDDRGRDALDKIYAQVFGAEAALVRHNMVSGTHALAVALFGLLRPGDIMLSVTGAPYDTLESVIGITGKNGDGSLADFGVEYMQIGLTPSGIDLEAVEEAICALGERVKVVYVQRSKGYSERKTLRVSQIGALAELVKRLSSAYVMVDNCYGEFVEAIEPTHVGADLIVGSLIKNPGGGMAECGGYIAGSARAVELASYRLTSPGIGAEVGATLGQNKNMFRGFFYAPHTVAQALKTAHFAAYIFAALGYATSPEYDEVRSDIIQAVRLGSPERIIRFCRGIQSASPVDSHLSPVPWDMPGYSSQVIMAAGAFVQGASIELSADAPLREPYTVFFQGGLTYESGRIGILAAARALLDD